VHCGKSSCRKHKICDTATDNAIDDVYGIGLDWIGHGFDGAVPGGQNPCVMFSLRTLGNCRIVLSVQQGRTKSQVQVIFAAEMRLSQHGMGWVCVSGMGSMAMGASPAPEDALLTNLAVKTGGAERLKQRQRQ